MEVILLILLGVTPLIFLPGGYDPFEPHKVGVVVTGAAIVASISLGRLFVAGLDRGFATALRGAAARFLDSLRREPAGAAMLLFLLSSAISTVASIRPPLSLHGSSARPAGLLVAAAMTILFLASRSAARSSAWLGRVAAVGTWTAGAASVYALLQLIGHDPFHWLGHATFDGNTRVPGPLGHPNTLGAYLAMALPLAIYTAVNARQGVARRSAIVVAGLALFVLAATLSRGAWVGAAGAVAAFLAVRAAGARPQGLPSPARRRRILLFVAAAIVFLLPLATPLGSGFVTRMRQVTDLAAPTTRSRLELWGAALGMLSDHPLLGVGTDAYGAAFLAYRTPAFSRIEWNATTDRAHNEALQIAATQGALGLLASILIVVFILRACLRIARQGGPGEAASAAAVAASLTAWGLSSLASFSLAATGSLAAVLAGWAAGRARAAEPGASGSPADAAAVGRRTLPAMSWAAHLASAILVGAIWAALLLPSWRAAVVGGRALAAPDADPKRVAGLERAASLAPWDDRWVAELGLTEMRAAFSSTDAAETWNRLRRSRAAYDRAADVAPQIAEYRASRARLLAEESSLRPEVVPPREAADSLAAALETDPHGSSTLSLVSQGYLRLGMLGEAHHAAYRSAWLYPDFALPMLDV
jgi:O-antigen ligase